MFSGRLLPSHERAMQDIANCRTESFGGEVYFCKNCNAYRYSYHSCKNRFCTKCGHDQIQAWLDHQKDRLLPVTYFLVTFTLHDNLRRLAGSHQKRLYDILFRASASALQKLAWDPQYIGGKIGMTGVLQTWTRDLSVLHPHIHYIVPGGGLDEQGNHWRPAKKNYLMPKRALSHIFRAKYRDALKKSAPDLFETIPPETWTQKWVVHLQAVGAGEKALSYLAPYLFQGPISNKRLVQLENGLVTFLYKSSKTRQWKKRTVPAEPFIASFLQHVLPPRFVRVRSYGLLHPNKHDLFHRARALLDANNTAAQTPAPPVETPQTEQDTSKEEKPKTIPCPQCSKPMRWIKTLAPTRISLLHHIRSP